MLLHLRRGKPAVVGQVDNEIGALGFVGAGEFTGHQGGIDIFKADGADETVSRGGEAEDGQLLAGLDGVVLALVGDEEIEEIIKGLTGLAKRDEFAKGNQVNLVVAVFGFAAGAIEEIG